MSIRLSLVLVVGCASEARLPASYFAETARTLPPGHVSVTGAVGGGATFYGYGGGGGARLRVGVGDGTEVGVEAARVDRVTSNDCGWDCPSTTSTLESRSVTVSLKRRLNDRASIIVGGGETQHYLVGGDPNSDDPQGTSIHGSLAVLGTGPLASGIDLYAGVRAIGTMAIDHKFGSAFLSVGGALGLALGRGPVRFYLEAGPNLLVPSLDSGIQGVAGLSLTL
jgi:hypothetical protein